MSPISPEIFRSPSTVIQHHLNVGLIENAQTIDKEVDSEPQQLIQQTTKEEGERGCVEQSRFDDVLQNEAIANSSTIQKDSASQQTNSQVHTSQQKALQKKYQPVEVLNRDGEWVGDYYVHRCLVMANLEGIDRKWALYDELGGKYAFWGQIRLPRVR